MLELRLTVHQVERIERLLREKANYYTDELRAAQERMLKASPEELKENMNSEFNFDTEIGMYQILEDHTRALIEKIQFQKDNQ